WFAAESGWIPTTTISTRSTPRRGIRECPGRSGSNRTGRAGGVSSRSARWRGCSRGPNTSICWGRSKTLRLYCAGVGVSALPGRLGSDDHRVLPPEEPDAAPSRLRGRPPLGPRAAPRAGDPCVDPRGRLPLLRDAGGLARDPRACPLPVGDRPVDESRPEVVLA